MLYYADSMIPGFRRRVIQDVQTRMKFNQQSNRFVRFRADLMQLLPIPLLAAFEGQNLRPLVEVYELRVLFHYREVIYILKFIIYFEESLSLI